MNFHPDRDYRGISILESMRRHGVYRSQFETGTSNGGLTAHPGGARWLWERRLFGGAYDQAPEAERPKYGALNDRRLDVGGAPRFGSAHLRLTEDVLARTTFCFPDSVFEPIRFGTAQHFDLIGDAQAFRAVTRGDIEEAEEGGVLDDYIEAHVHGVISIGQDVEAVVLDPCFRGTAVEADASRLGVPLEWHAGRILTVSELGQHPDFRGRDILRLGREISRAGLLDARILGEAVLSGVHDPQALKRVCHCIARFGNPARESHLTPPASAGA